MTLLSVVINADTRAGFKNAETSAANTFDGCRSIDFLIDGVRNKIKFFEAFQKEIILFIDEHEMLPREVVDELRFMVDTLVIRKHSKRFGDIENYEKFNPQGHVANWSRKKRACGSFARSNASLSKIGFGTGTMRVPSSGSTCTRASVCGSQ